MNPRVGLRELGDGIERQMGKLARLGQDQESRFACGRMVLKGVGAETGAVAALLKYPSN